MILNEKYIFIELGTSKRVDQAYDAFGYFTHINHH